MSDAEDESHLSIPLMPSGAFNFIYIHTNEARGLRSSSGNIVAEESMPCECRHLSQSKGNDPASEACGEDSDCINRLLLVECDHSCPAGQSCQNKRFQQRKYAKIHVVDTPGKGFGLVTKQDLSPGQLIIEYVGEVLSHSAFVKRSLKYSEEGASHFYFMTLTTDEIIDASQKGNISRFMNHSCNPNCETQKWIVGKQMRIGLFAQKQISKGTELTFDYKFERFGDQAQPCRCGEANCKGTIGSQRKGSVEPVDNDEEESESLVKKTSKTRLPSLSQKKESVNGLDDPNDVQKIVKNILHIDKVNALLRQLRILNATTLIPCLRKFLHLHGLKILHALLVQYQNEPNVVYHVLCVLEKLPIATRNSVEDSNLVPLVTQLSEHEDDTLADLSKKILETWQGLTMVYKIPKVGTPAAEASPEASLGLAAASVWPAEGGGIEETASHSTGVEGAESNQDEKRVRVAMHNETTAASSDGELSRGLKRKAVLPTAATSIETWADRESEPSKDYFDELSGQVPGSQTRSRFHAPHTAVTSQSSRQGDESNGKNREERHMESKRSRRYDDQEGGSNGNDPRSHHRHSSHRTFSESRWQASESREELSKSHENLAKSKESMAAAVQSEAPVAEFDTRLDSLGQELPEDWRSAVDDQGQTYYFNVNTRATQWEIPTALGKDTTADMGEPPVSKPKIIGGREGLSSQAIQDVIEKAKSLVREKEEKEAELARSAKEHTAKLRDQISDIVIQYLSQFKLQFASSEEFKKQARKLTHALLEKEQKSRESHHQSDSDYIDKSAKKKMKVYLRDYLSKLGYKKPDEGYVKKDRPKSKKV